MLTVLRQQLDGLLAFTAWPAPAPRSLASYVIASRGRNAPGEPRVTKLSWNQCYQYCCLEVILTNRFGKPHFLYSYIFLVAYTRAEFCAAAMPHARTRTLTYILTHYDTHTPPPQHTHRHARTHSLSVARARTFILIT